MSNLSPVPSLWRLNNLPYWGRYMSNIPYSVILCHLSTMAFYSYVSTEILSILNKELKFIPLSTNYCYQLNFKWPFLLSNMTYVFFLESLPCNSCWPWTQMLNPATSASQVLGWQLCTNMPGYAIFLLRNISSNYLCTILWFLLSWTTFLNVLNYIFKCLENLPNWIFFF
jgi:hypothetical protein